MTRRRERVRLKERLAPYNIDKQNWFYVDGSVIELIHQVVDATGTYLQTDHIKIRLNALRKAISLRARQAKGTR